MSSKFGQIQLGTTELAALEHKKIDAATFFVSQLCLYLGNSQVSIYRTIGPLVNNMIFFIIVGNEEMHEISDEFEFRQDFTTNYGVSCPWVSKKPMYNFVNTLAPLFLIESSSFFACNKDNHEVWTEIKIKPNRTMHCGVSCH